MAFCGSTTLAKTTCKMSLSSDCFNVNSFIACNYLALWTKMYLNTESILLSACGIFEISYFLSSWFDWTLRLRFVKPRFQAGPRFLPAVSDHMRTVVVVTCASKVPGLVIRKIIQVKCIFIRFQLWSTTGLLLGLRPANERRRYKVTPSLICWAQS